MRKERLKDEHARHQRVHKLHQIRCRFVVGTAVANSLSMLLTGQEYPKLQGSLHVCEGEVITFPKKGFLPDFREGIREAVTKVQRSGMIAFPKPTPSLPSSLHLPSSYRNQLDPGSLDKEIKLVSAGDSGTTFNDECRFK